MPILELLLVALAPAAFLLWFFYHKDRYHPEPLRLIGLTFSLGALSTIAAIAVESIGLRLIHPKGVAYSFLQIFIVVALVEELCKFAAVRAKAFNSPDFDEPMDGIVYGVSAALGFATVENLIYVLNYGLGTGIVRAFLAVPGHALFGAIMGFYLGQSKYLKKPSLVYAAILVPTIFHGIYDSIAFLEPPGVVKLILLGLFIFYVYNRWVSREIRTAEDEEERGPTDRR